MKKILIIFLTLITLSACAKDELADLRKKTVQDYIDNKELRDDVLKRCANREIQDFNICETPKEALNSLHDFW